MSEVDELCENCGEAIETDIIECNECGTPMCELCANICRKCKNYFCDGCYHDHKKECK